MKIHYKITLVFGIIMAVILSGIYVYLNGNLKRYTYQRIRTNLMRNLSLARTFIEEGFDESPSVEEMDKTADKIGDDLDLRVTIIDRNGRVLGDSELTIKEIEGVENHLFRPEVQGALKSGSGEERRFSTTIRKDMLYIAGVFGKGDKQDVIRLAMPLSDIELISDHLKRLVIISMLSAFILSIIISYLASFIITKPVKEISSAAREIAAGNFSNRVSVSTRDEIGDLAHAFNDMSEQIKSRIDEITAGKSRIEAMLLSMFDGVMVVDRKGFVILVNKSLKDTFDIKDEASGKRPIEIIRNVDIQNIVDNTLGLKTGAAIDERQPNPQLAADSRAGYRQKPDYSQLKKPVQPGQTCSGGFHACEISILLQQERSFLVHATPVNRDDIIEGAVLVFHDITRLRHLEKVRKDFVANVSHELRTPVSCIKGYSETLLDGALEDKKHAHEFLNVIYSESNRLANLIDDILNLSKIESGKLGLDLTNCSVARLINEIVNEFKKPAAKRAVSIKTWIPDDIPDILADKARISQVLVNLIDNAIKYNHEGGSITISASDKATHVQIEVSDTGIGIPERDLPRIFERFYRVDKARSKALGGTGLGLSIAKHIVQEHNGGISVKSTLGQGTTFIFTIPKADHISPPPNPPSANHG
ncbi:HAMP domain-containing protein [bacterium]|nr:HAMP domain-containing protein [bacterium]